MFLNVVFFSLVSVVSRSFLTVDSQHIRGAFLFALFYSSELFLLKQWKDFLLDYYELDFNIYRNIMEWGALLGAAGKQAWHESAEESWVQHSSTFLLLQVDSWALISCLCGLVALIPRPGSSSFNLREIISSEGGSVEKQPSCYKATSRTSVLGRFCSLAHGYFCVGDEFIHTWLQEEVLEVLKSFSDHFCCKSECTLEHLDVFFENTVQSAQVLNDYGSSKVSYL